MWGKNLKDFTHAEKVYVLIFLAELLIPLFGIGIIITGSLNISFERGHDVEILFGFFFLLFNTIHSQPLLMVGNIFLLVDLIILTIHFTWILNVYRKNDEIHERRGKISLIFILMASIIILFIFYLYFLQYRIYIMVSDSINLLVRQLFLTYNALSYLSTRWVILFSYIPKGKEEQELLEKIEAGLINKNEIYESERDTQLELANKAENEGDWKKASKHYRLASILCQELGEKDLAQKYKELSKEVKRR